MKSYELCHIKKWINDKSKQLNARYNSTMKYDVHIKYIILKTPFIVSLIEQYNGNSKSRLVKEVMHQVKWKKCVENIQSVRMRMNKI